MDNKAIVRTFLDEIWNKRDMSAIDRYIAPNHANHGPVADDLPPGIEGIRVFMQAFLSAFPDVKCTVETQETDGDLVRTVAVYQGTQSGQLMDFPPSNRKATVRVVSTDRMANGKIAETWNEWDANDMLRQLGHA